MESARKHAISEREREIAATHARRASALQHKTVPEAMRLVVQMLRRPTSLNGDRMCLCALLCAGRPVYVDLHVVGEGGDEFDDDDDGMCVRASTTKGAEASIRV